MKALAVPVLFLLAISRLVAEADDTTAAIDNGVAALHDATSAVKHKTKPKDFDPILKEINSALAGARITPAADRAEVFLELESASHFVRGWQRYLLDQAAGHDQAAAHDLRMLSENSAGSFSPIPRSELRQLEMREAATASSTTVAKIQLHALGDVPSALAQIEMLQRMGGGSGHKLGRLQNALMNLESANTAHQIGNNSAALQQLNSGPFGVSPGLVSAQAPGGNGSAFEAVSREIASLKTVLLLKVVQALLAWPYVPTPHLYERAADYLQRLAANRAQADDWTGLQQVLRVYQQLVMDNPPPWLAEDLSGLHAYLVGAKLEKAGETLDAIRSYRRALATRGKYFPAAPATDKLAALKKAHLDLWEQAIQQPIKPAAAR